MPPLKRRCTRISPGYFDAAGTALLSGRALTWHDDKNAPRVAVVNREFARKIFGSVRRSDRRLLTSAGDGIAHPGGGHCGGRKVRDA